MSIQTSHRREKLAHELEHAAHLLPAQGPIGVFIHHNTLHAFQHLPFEEAVNKAADLYGAEPYMRQEAFRKDIERGRILPSDIDRILQSELNDAIPGTRLDRRSLRKAMLHPGIASSNRRPFVGIWTKEISSISAVALPCLMTTNCIRFSTSASAARTP